MKNGEPLEKYFLDDKMDLLVKKIRNQNSTDYNIIYTLLDFSYKIFQEFSDKDHDEFGIYLYSTYMQFIKYWQAYFILIERGLPEAAQSLLRSIHEFAFRICASCIDHSIIEDFTAEALYNKQGILNKISELKLYTLIPQDKIIEYQEAYEKELEKHPYKKITKFQLAQKADLEEQYIFFQFLSSFVHADFDCSGSIIDLREDGVSIDGDLIYGNIHEDIGITIYIYNETTKKFLEVLNIDKYIDEFNQLSKMLDEYLK